MFFKITFNKVIIIVMWVLWIVFSTIVFNNEVDMKKMYIKYGISISAECIGVRPRTGIEFTVSYENEDSYEKNILSILCEEEYISELFNSRIKATFYEGEIMGLIANGKTLVSIDESLESYNNNKTPFYFLISLIIATWLLYLRDTPKRIK